MNPALLIPCRDRPVPRYYARPDGCTMAGGLQPYGYAGHFVVDRASGANATAEILDKLLPETSPRRGARRVSAPQAAFLAMIGNDPVRHADLIKLARQKLGREGWHGW